MQAREGDLAGDAALERAHARRHAGLASDRRSLPAARDERERDAVDLGVLRARTCPSSFGRVADAAQAAADDLLAEQLGAEGADAEDVGDGVGVPALGQHRDGDDAADLLAELARLADRVHHLAQQVLVGDFSASRPGKRCAVLAP